MDAATIASLLQATLTGSTETIKAAEQGLEVAEKEQSFFPQLLMVVKEKSLSRNIRKAAALYTKKFTRNRLKEKDQFVINAIAEHLLNVLSDQEIDISLKRLVGGSLEYLLINDHQNVVREILEKHCIGMLEAAKNGDEANINYEFLGFFIQSLVSSAGTQTKNFNLFIQSSFIPFCSLANRIFKYVPVSEQEENKESTIHMLRILKLFSYSIKAYMKKIVYSDVQTVKLLYDDTLTELFNTSFEFTFPGNEISTNLIFFNNSKESAIVDLFHSVKADYIQSLKYYMRTVFIQFKDAKMISSSAVLNSPALIPSLINALHELFSKTSYHKIKSNNLIKLIEEILNVEIVAVRNSFYFAHFLEYKQAIIHGCILKVLGFSPIDCTVFGEEPEEFINQLLQIIEMDSDNYAFQKDRETMSLEDGGEVEDYSNLRTLGSIFLEAFAKHIDGSLAEILTFSIGILKGEINQEFPKALLFLMISILRDQILQKEYSHINIINIMCSILKDKPVPEEIEDSEATPLLIYESNIEYLMILLTIYRYYSKSEEVLEADSDLIYEVVFHILSKKEVSQALKISAQDLVISLASREDKYQIPLIHVINTIAINDVLGRETTLETLANLFKYASESLIDNPVVIQTVKNLCRIVYEEVSKKTTHNQLVINKCWNVISDICENEIFIPKLIPEIEECVMPLLQFIDGIHNYDYEENILMMMSSFISKSKCVTQNELVMFEIIPKLFYSQYEFAFGHAFETLNIFILHGSKIIISAPQALKAIIDMAVCCMNTIQVKEMFRNEAENCYGVILLQSLILSCGNFFTNDIFVEITKSLTNRLDNPPVNGNILHSNILATLALVVMLGHKSFSNEDNDALLQKILENHYCFVVRYSTKIAIIALSEIMIFYHLPFVSSRLPHLLGTILGMLETDEKIGVLDKSPINDEEKDYDAAISTVSNMIVNMDEIEHFKSKFNLIKENEQSLLQKVIEELPERKVQFLKNVLNVSKVLNENRIIFKIKR